MALHHLFCLEWPWLFDGSDWNHCVSRSKQSFDSLFLLGCPWKLVTIVSKLGYFTYLGDVSNLHILGWNNLVTRVPAGHPSRLLSCIFSYANWGKPKLNHSHASFSDPWVQHPDNLTQLFQMWPSKSSLQKVFLTYISTGICEAQLVFCFFNAWK